MTAAAIATDLPRTLTTGHVGLNVSDLDRSRTFYEQVFGFTTIGLSEEEGRSFAFLGDGDRLVLTLWQQSDGRFSAATPGLHHLSFKVDSIAEVRAFEERLRSSDREPLHGGIVPHAEGADSGGIFFEDPDGIRLEIFAPSGAGEHTAPTTGAPTCGFF